MVETVFNWMIGFKVMDLQRYDVIGRMRAITGQRLDIGIMCDELDEDRSFLSPCKAHVLSCLFFFSK